MQLIRQVMNIMLFLGVYVTTSYAGECQDRCSSLLRDVLTLEICREARKLYPRPRLGNACSDGMEKGYYDACVPMCLGKKSENLFGCINLTNSWMIVFVHLPGLNS